MNLKINFKKLLFPGIPIFIVVFIPSIFQIFWKVNSPEGFYYPGFLISDQNTYTAIFRSVLERGNGITYSYPYAAKDTDNPAIFFQLPFTLLAWIWKICGGNLLSAWEIFRYIFGVGFYYLAYLFINDLFKKIYPNEFANKNAKKIINIFFLILIFGGGFAWFVGTFKYLSLRLFMVGGEYPYFLDSFTSIEKQYAGWMLNLFRNVFHPPEMQYHFFFFLAVYGIIRQKPIFIFIGEFMACISGVFVAIELSGIIIFYFALESIITRKKECVKKLIISLTIFIFFLLYYKVFLMQFPIAKILVDQHLINLHNVIQLHAYFPAYGILIFTAPLVFLNKNFRKILLGKPEGRLMIAWFIVVLLLMQNDKILTLKRSIQPPHFTRGYMYTALFLISALGIFPYLMQISNISIKKLNIFLVISLLFFIPDNVISTISRFYNPPHPFFLTIPKESKEALDFLNQIHEQENVFCPDLRFGDQIPAFSHHSSIFGQIYATPYILDKQKMMKDFFDNKNVDLFIQKYKITILAIPKYLNLGFEKKVQRSEWEIIFENTLWKIYKLP